MSRKSKGSGGGGDNEDGLGGAPGTFISAFEPIQDGFMRTPAIWEGTTGFIGDATETFVWAGFIFDISSTYSTDGERGLPLEPPIFNYMELTLSRVSAVANTSGAGYVFFVPEFEPVNYRTGRKASQRDEWLIGYTNSAFSNTTSVILPIGDKDDIILPIPDGTQPAETIDILNTNDQGILMNNFGRFQSYLQNAQSDGTFALSVYIEVVGGDVQFYSTRGSGTTPGLNVVEHGFHSGHNTGILRDSRIRHCPRSGLPDHADKYIPDGYVEGLMVSPDWYEPEDRTGMDRIIPSEEGVIKDEAL